MADKEYKIDPNNMSLLDSIRTVGGHVASGILDIASLPSVAYDLTNKVLKYAPATIPFIGQTAAAARTAFGNDVQLPGSETMQQVGEDVRKFSHEVGSDIAGRDIKPGLLTDNTTADKVGTAASILTNMIPVTGGPIKRGFEALKTFETGIKSIDKTIPVAAEIGSFLSPLVPTANPKALVGINAAIGTGLTVAADMLTPDPIDAEIEKFKQQWSTAHTTIEDQAKADSDIATQAVGDTLDAKDAAALEAAIANFKTADWSNPVDVETKKQQVIKAGIPDLGDYQGAALGVGAIVLGAAAAYHNRAAINSKLLEWVGGKEFGKRAAEDAVSKREGTNLSTADVFAAQTTDASIPIKRESLNPEVMGARFEKIASAWDVQKEAILRDGEIRNSIVKLSRPVEEFVRDVQAVAADPVKLQLLRDGANAMSESNNRVRSWLEAERPVAVGRRNVDDPIVVGEFTSWLNRERAKIAPGTATTQAELAALEKRHAFHTLDPATNTVTPFSDILATRRAAMADPQIGPLLREWKDITKKIGLDYRLDKGLISKKQHADLWNLHPSYFPTRIQGKHMSPLDLSMTGGRLHQGDPLKEFMPYIHETVRDVAHEEMKRAAIFELRDRAAKGDTRALDLIGRDDVFKKNHYNADKMVTYVDYNGNARMIEIRDPTYRLAMQMGANSAALRLNTGMLRAFSFPSRALEQLTTGPLAAFVGSAFAPVGAAYGSVATLINRPAGTVAGFIDKLVQDTGVFGKGKNGINRGFRGDPTFYAQVAAQMLPNVLAVLSKNAGMALEASVRNNNWFANAVGPGTLDAYAKSLSNYYKASTVYALEKRGLHGGATPTATYTVPKLDDLEKSLTPAAKMSEGWQVTRNFAYDLLGAIGNAPQSAFFKQNKGRMSEGLLTTRTRNVMGDPTKSGLAHTNIGKAVVGGAVASPWGGVTLQSFSRFAHSIRTNPAGTAAAIGATVAMPTMLASQWNVMLGPEYVNHQFAVRTPDQASGAIYIGIPGQPPEEGLEIPIDQLMRPFKVLTDVIHGSALGLMDGSIFKPENEAMRSLLEDGMKTRYGLWGDAMKSAFSQVAPAVPPAANALLGMFGGDVQMRTYMDAPQRVVENKAAGATDSTARYTDAKFLGYDISARMEAMFNNLGGQVGRAILGTIESGDRAIKDGLTKSDFAKDFGDRWMMNLEQSTRMASGLWGHSATISPSQEASSKALQESMEGLKKLDAASKKLRSLSGSGSDMVGAKGREIESLIGSGPVQFKDQQMYALAFDAQHFLSLYNRQYAGHIKDLYEQRQSIMSSEKVSPRTKQALVNDVSKQIVETNRQALSAIQQWQWKASKTYGREIDLRRIELDKPITQFKSVLD